MNQEENFNPDEQPERKKAIKKHSAKSYAVWLLSRRDYSAKELMSKMLAKDYTPQEAEAALSFCQQNKFQDDSRFAEARVLSRQSNSGNAKLKMELGQKGLGPELITAALGEAGSEIERAIQVSSRFEGKELDEKMKAKVWRYLASRGFSSSSVKAAMKSLAQKSVQNDENSSGDWDEM